MQIRAAVTAVLSRRSIENSLYWAFRLKFTLLMKYIKGTLLQRSLCSEQAKNDDSILKLRPVSDVLIGTPS